MKSTRIGCANGGGFNQTECFDFTLFMRHGTLFSQSIFFISFNQQGKQRKKSRTEKKTGEKQYKCYISLYVWYTIHSMYLIPGSVCAYAPPSKKVDK